MQHLVHQRPCRPRQWRTRPRTRHFVPDGYAYATQNERSCSGDLNWYVRSAWKLPKPALVVSHAGENMLADALRGCRASCTAVCCLRGGQRRKGSPLAQLARRSCCWKRGKGSAVQLGGLGWGAVVVRGGTCSFLSAKLCATLKCAWLAWAVSCCYQLRLPAPLCMHACMLDGASLASLA